MRPFPRLRLFGVPLRIYPSFAFTAFFVGLSLHVEAVPALEAIAAFLIALVIQEGAHAYALERLGYQPRMAIHWLGGETWVACAKPTSARRLIGAYFAGPAAGLVLALFCFVLAYDASRLPLFAAHLDELGRIAGIYALASLLPIYPLAGGHALRAALTKRFGARAFDVAYTFSAAASLVVFLALWRWPTPIGLVAPLLALYVNATLRWQSRLQRLDREVIEKLNEGHRALHQPAGAERAIEIARGLLATVRSIELKSLAVQLLAWGHLAERNYDACERALRRLPPGRDPDPALEGALYLGRGEFKYAAVLLADGFERRREDGVASMLAHALVKGSRLDEAAALALLPEAGPKTFAQLMSPLFHAGRFEEARALGERWFEREKLPLTAFNLACTFVRLGRLEEAEAWLSRAVQAGWRDLKQLDEDPDLAPLRNRPGFHHARAQLTSLGRTLG